MAARRILAKYFLGLSADAVFLGPPRLGVIETVDRDLAIGGYFALFSYERRH